MPWKLVIGIGILALFVFFAGINLAPVDISIGFYVFQDVPVFLPLIISFLLGSLAAVPLVYRQVRKKKKKALDQIADEPIPAVPETDLEDEEKA